MSKGVNKICKRNLVNIKYFCILNIKYKNIIKQ
jgi:hypothetical protein